jgi:hypothetical protein
MAIAVLVMEDQALALPGPNQNRVGVRPGFPINRPAVVGQYSRLSNPFRSVL